jgi:glycosyltransferase involved in cell wall biosynthesis
VTQVGHEGLEARDGEQLLVASSPEAFADAVVRLYEAPGQRARMGEAARAFVTQHYTWEQRLTPFVEAVNALLPHRARPSPSVGASPSRPYAPDVYVEE